MGREAGGGLVGGAGVLWQSPCLACMRPWVPFLELKKYK